MEENKINGNFSAKNGIGVYVSRFMMPETIHFFLCRQLQESKMALTITMCILENSTIKERER